MIPVSTSELAPLEFDANSEEQVKVTRAQSNKIGWLHSLADAPGTKFDITIKDALGRTKFQRLGFGGETEKNGELINLDTQLGEELQVEITNIQKGKNVKVFLN